MTEEQYAQLVMALRVMSTGINQLIDIQMMILGEMNEDNRDLVDKVHNTYGKFLTDDSWMEDMRAEGLIE